VATLVLRACAVEPSTTEPFSSPDAEESRRARWARLGVTVNELALPVLCLNLPLLDGAEHAHREAQDSTPLDGALASGPSVPGEPVHISLRRLLRRPPALRVAGRDVFVCENPNIVAIAADRLGSACAPMVCTDGMPAAAQQTLLAQLAAGGARLRYHGDFDWAGLAIGNFVMRKFGAEPWRFGTMDYLSAAAGNGVALRGDEQVMAQWDDRLTRVMSDRRIVVHEEGVVEALLTDLAVSPAQSDSRGSSRSG
jgi:uncharacterized protein (TIGR02679 family)